MRLAFAFEEGDSPGLEDGMGIQKLRESFTRHRCTCFLKKTVNSRFRTLYRERLRSV
jgi:hypothetical protein